MMPVLFAMFSIMRSAVELKGAPFFWVWQDLSAKDPLYILPIPQLSLFFLVFIDNSGEYDNFTFILFVIPNT